MESASQNTGSSEPEPENRTRAPVHLCTREPFIVTLTEESMPRTIGHPHHMVQTEAAAADLLERVKAKRQDVDRFVATALPRKRRLLNVTIVAGTLAAAFTAGPAVAGQPFTAWLTMTLGLTSPAWRLLCGAATGCSIAATVATQLLKSQNTEEHVTRALSCRAKLDVLEIGLSTGHIELPQATTEFIRCVEETAFIESR